MEVDYEKISKLQADKNLSNRAMSAKLNLSSSGYGLMMKNKSCSAKVMLDIASILNVDCTELILGYEYTKCLNGNCTNYIEASGHIKELQYLCELQQAETKRLKKKLDKKSAKAETKKSKVTEATRIKSL